MSRSKYGKTTEQVRKLLEANPKIKAAQVMEKLGTSKTYTYMLLRKAKAAGAKRPHLPLFKDAIADRMASLPIAVDTQNKDVDVSKFVYLIEEATLVNKVSVIETIDFIESKGLDYHLGNVVKYITKPGRGLENLLTAQWYLTRAIERTQD